jgi:hypothetical protein
MHLYDTPNAFDNTRPQEDSEIRSQDQWQMVWDDCGVHSLSKSDGNTFCTTQSHIKDCVLEKPYSWKLEHVVSNTIEKYCSDDRDQTFRPRRAILTVACRETVAMIHYDSSNRSRRTSQPHVHKNTRKGRGQSSPP